MINLVIDIGNSRSKLAVFNNRELNHIRVLNQIPNGTLEQLLADYNVENSILSSVAGGAADIEALLSARTNYLRFSAGLKSPVTVQYQTPHTLGLDRLAGVIGAHSLFPEKNCLVIDAGTCITYDAVTAEGLYSGGSISPGLNMRLQAMHTFTGRLPQVELDEAFDEFQGTDTRSSMLSGTINGTIGEAAGFIAKYKSRYPDLQVILCGGDAIFFDTRLKNSIFGHTFMAEPNLVLIGLNEVIHQYND